MTMRVMMNSYTGAAVDEDATCYRVVWDAKQRKRGPHPMDGHYHKSRVTIVSGSLGAT